MAQLFNLKSTPLNIDAQAQRIYDEYPRKVGSAAALTAIRKALKTESYETLVAAVVEYARACKATQRERKLIPHPSTWFNQERWKDDVRDWYEDNDFECDALFMRMRNWVAKFPADAPVPAPTSGQDDYAKGRKVAEFCGWGKFRRGEVTLSLWRAGWKELTK